MEKLPYIILFLYSIPESLVLITLAGTLYGYGLRENYHRILLLGITLALSSYVIRALPVDLGINALIEIPVFVLLTALYLRISPTKAFFYILTAFVVIIIVESVSYPTIAFITGKTLKQVVDSTGLRMATGWTNLTVIIGFSYFLKRKNITVFKTPIVFQTATRTGKINILLVALVLVQSLLAGVSILVMYSGIDGVWPVLNNSVVTAITGILLLTVPALSMFLIKRMFSMAEKEVISETQEAFLDNIDKLFTTIRGQRHDFIHHVQVIYSMLSIGRTTQAIDYLDNMLEEIQDLSNVIKVNDPVLSALFNTKVTIAERHNIKLDIKMKAKSSKLDLKPYVLVKILGNLIDNAIEAVAEEPSEHRRVKVVIESFTPLFVVEVINRGHIGSEELQKMFISGFSTKEGHSGIGLAVVKDLVERNRGHLSAGSDNNEIVLRVELPMRNWG